MGGCMLKCDSRLPCGHACTLNCHPDDSLHEEIKCYSKCAKKRECQHACPLKCWQPCGDCRVRVRKTLPCGHTTSQPCYLAPELCVCDYPCTKGLPCGHNAVVPCHQAPELVVCKAKCEAVLPCGHPCTGTCSSCEQGNNHVACTKKCERTLVCGHPCDSPCVKDCPPCKRKCANKCVHSTCNLKHGALRLALRARDVSVTLRRAVRPPSLQRALQVGASLRPSLHWSLRRAVSYVVLHLHP
ncbi:NFX1type zinc finger-containing protein 1, putative [Acanthamoeba castellanii str. Neff]|uniref:NFX1type zinc finger-containing protein 1, putative n=1 Tax=Acanthamoeba castellanii (strain ATCC 30010 / Neff) TaxID=1257118 RepID=L8H2G5_ACACF|nr:NFX1type zinc finger-containing protein 1, putative [Acanthamoeba castellanii str. Neff]ELR18943.1 NFX1type zinc finger-containing protein 1, putative [Acanthamoeba castellanii str. Neff]